MTRYILSDLKTSAPTFPDLLKFADGLPPTLQPMAPQALNASRNGFTMLLYGDEEYKSEDKPDEKRKPGGRHRVIVESKAGRPRRMTWERTKGRSSKL